MLLFLRSCLLLLALAACAPIQKLDCDAVSPARDIPWLRTKIAELEKDKDRNGDVQIFRYDYRNRHVFWITGYGDDRPSELYECDGEKICEPDGGITGKGNGKCPDFFGRRENEHRIWQLKDAHQLR